MSGFLARPIGRRGFRREPENPVMPLRHRCEIVAYAGGRLRSAEHEIAVRGKPHGKTRKHGTFCGVVEIDQHVPAKDHIERAERLAVVEEVLVAELDLAANLGAELSSVADFIEIFDQERYGQAPLYLELAVKPFTRLAECILDKVRR